MKKEIRFSAAIDTKEFDRAMEGMQQKLQKIYQTSDQSRTQFESRIASSRVGIGGPVTEAEKTRNYQGEMRERQQLLSFIRDQQKQQDLINKELDKQILKKKELLKLGKDTLEIDKQILTSQEKLKASRELAIDASNRIRTPGFNGEGGFFGIAQRAGMAAMGARQGGAGLLGQMGAAGTAVGRGLGAFAAANPLALAGGVGSLLAAGMGTVADISQRFAEAPRNILSAQGSAMQSAASPVLQSLTGGSLDALAFSGERSRAIKMAAEEIRTTRRNDLIKLGAATIGVIAAGALTLGLAPAALASAGLLAKTGIIGAGVWGASEIYDQGLDRLTGKYDAQMEARRVAAVEENYESLKRASGLKNFAFQRFQEDTMKNLPLQRATGMSDREMERMLLINARSGFQFDDTRRAMGAIASAGGSTGAMTDIGGILTSQRLERNLGLSNAARAYGRLSSLLGGGGDSAQALLNIQNMGSQFSGMDRQERNVFTENMLDMFQRNDATSVGSQQALMGRFSGFMTGGSMSQMRGAAVASNFMNQLSGASGGIRGALQAAAINRDPKLRLLSIDEKNLLLGMTEEQILSNAKSGDPFMMNIMKKAGISSPEELIEKIKKPAMVTRGDIASKVEQIKGLDPNSDEYNRLSSDIIAGMYSGPQGDAVAKMSAEQRKALVKGIAGLELSPDEKRSEQEAKDLMSMATGGVPDTAGEKLKAQKAEEDISAVSVVGSFQKEVGIVISGLSEFNTAIRESASIIARAYKGEDVDKGMLSTAISTLNSSFVGTPEKAAPPADSEQPRFGGNK